MTERIDAAERLLDLVIALSHVRYRMSKAQIRATVRGYSAGNTEAFERKFERDKETLRELGIPIITLTDPVHEDDIGYRIDGTDYQLPPVSLTPAQMGVLSVAAEVWQDSGFTGAARRGLTKLRAVTQMTQAVDNPVALRVRGPDSAIGDLLDAISERVPIRFRYRAASSGVTAERKVEPWRVYVRGRGWYLYGFDVERQAPRSFRTSRIVGAVRTDGEPGSVTIPDQQQPVPEQAETQVRLALRPERAAALRARGTIVDTMADPSGGVREVVALTVSDVEEFADEIAGYGEAAIVLSPEQLREATMRRLHAVAGLGRQR